MSNDYSSIGTVMVDGDGSIVVSGNAKYSDSSGDYGYHNYIIRHPAQKSTARLIWTTQSDDFSGTLAPQGAMFLLTPNRWAFWSIEPHVRLWGVQFMPKTLADALVRRRLGVAYSDVAQMLSYAS